MRTIVCPVDFSEISENAANYAARVARDLDAEVVIAHAQHVPVLDVHTPPSTVKDMMDQQQLDNSRKLDGLASKLKTSVGGNIRTWQTFGLVVDMIREIEAESAIYLVIMGTKGVNNPFDKWIGTTSSDVMQRCEIPMIIVPDGSVYTGWPKAGYATDFTMESDNAILDFQELVRPFNSTLNIIHVSNKKVNADEMLAVVKHFEPNANVDTIAGEDIASELNDYVWENDLQLIGLKRHKRGFINNLFHKSISKELAMTSKMPVLIF
ncbi:MAG: universal stress protein [Bacteroidetes bacterium]|jgi:nucleotide-binding universal stress UspA family protein|nr:universal stress protein [Bacteroidota bacterium]